MFIETGEKRLFNISSVLCYMSARFIPSVLRLYSEVGGVLSRQTNASDLEIRFILPLFSLLIFPPRCLVSTL